MKKLFTLLCAASLFAFVACEPKTETAAEGTEQVVEETEAPAEDLQIEEMQEEVVDSASAEHEHAEGEEHSEEEHAE